MPGDGISRWTGEFLARRRELAFRAASWPRLCSQLRFIALLGGVLYAAILVPNWSGLGAGTPFLVMLGLRLGTALCLVGVAAVCRPNRSQRSAHGMLALAVVLLVTTRLAENALAPGLRPAGPGQGPVVFPVLPLAVFATVAVPLRLALAWNGVGILLLMGDMLARHGLREPVTQLTLLNVALACSVGYAFRVTINHLTRRDFLLLRNLKREVAERQAAEREALRANAAKSRFLTIMSHEIRTPLNGVLGGVQLLEEGPVLPEQRRHLELTARSGEQLARLLDNVLDLSRIEADRLELVLEPFDPADLLAGVQGVLAPLAQAKGLRLRLEWSGPRPPALVGDLIRLRQVLINLAGNGVKFTTRGEVAVLMRTEAPGQDGGRMRCAFEVADTGPGLEPDDQGRLWELFEQGRESPRRPEDGIGLGLAISRSLVSAMGGDLRLESAPGQGSRFHFLLELPVAALATAPPVAAVRPLRILVVDDLEANRTVAEGLLAALGHRPQGAATGAEALARCRTEPFDAILVDLHLPDLDGMELHRRLCALLKATTGPVPVYLASADTERSKMQACLDAGMRGILPKPLHIGRLAEVFGRVPRTAGSPDFALLPLVDIQRVASLRTDLGASTWARGIEECRASAEASLAELTDPTKVPEALHRLAGLAGAFAMPRLLAAARRAERAMPAGATAAIDELAGLARDSVAALRNCQCHVPMVGYSGKP